MASIPCVQMLSAVPHVLALVWEKITLRGGYIDPSAEQEVDPFRRRVAIGSRGLVIAGDLEGDKVGRVGLERLDRMQKCFGGGDLRSAGVGRRELHLPSQRTDAVDAKLRHAGIIVPQAANGQGESRGWRGRRF